MADAETNRAPEAVHQEAEALAHIFSGDSEMARRMRAFDWSQTPLGPPETWSPALRMVIKLMLANRFPMILWWGPQFIQFYNDPYRPIPGNKHPRSMGQPASECWSEIWHVIGSLVETPFRCGPATWDDDIYLEINRHGFVEETHFTIAYSPVPDETVESGIGGVLATVHEITGKVVGDRRVVVLRDLGTRSAEARTAEEACSVAAQTLAMHPKDIPFALLYLVDPDRKRARLAGTAGVTAGEAASPAVLPLMDDEADGSLWPLAEALRCETMQAVTELHGRLGNQVPRGPWTAPPHTAVVVPIRSNKAHHLAGFLVAGISARLQLDDSYRDFLNLVSSQIATSIANAREYEEEKRRAEALAEIDRAKTAFFSNVSHEFRTPLALMLGPLEDARGKAQDGDRQSLEIAHRNGLRLLKLVNSLLDFSRIEAGRVEACYEPLDLGTLTTDLASNFRSAIEKAGMRLVVDCPPLAEPVCVDRGMWEKIVLNLLSNAFKFTLQGEIAVTLALRNGAVELAVRDTGVGIPAEEQPHLFERFYRAKSVQGRTYEGTGIGLALVQELVRLHGGTIQVQSAPGQGSTFMVSIPLGTSHLRAERIGAGRSLASTRLGATPYVEEALRWLPDASASGSEPVSVESIPVGEGAARHVPETAGARLLLADDNADMRDYVRRLLGADYQVETVPDGQAALEVIKERRPDLVLTDVMMPRVDGFELLRRLRADPLTQPIPVILLSARAGEESRVEGLEVGADDYLVKPFSARELRASVESHLKLARLRQGLQASEAEYRSLFEHMLNGFAYCRMLYDEQGRPEDFVYLAVNNAFGRLTGLTDVIGKRVTEVIPRIKELTPGLFDSYGRVASTGIPERFEIDFTPLNLYLSVSVYSPAKGYFVATFDDMTERKRAEEALRANEEKYRSLFENNLDAVLLTVPNGEILAANQAACAMFGMTEEEICRAGRQGLVHWDDPRAQALVEERARAGKVRGELTFRRRDGTTFPVEGSSVIMHGPEPRSFVILRDITARKRAEEAQRLQQAELQQKTSQLLAMFEHSNAGLVLFEATPPYKVLAANRYYEQLWPEPRSSQGLAGLALTDFAPGLEEAGIAEVFRKVVESGKGVSIPNTPYDHMVGGRRWWNWTLEPVIQDGKVVALAHLAVEVTAEVKAREAIRESEERLRTLAAAGFEGIVVVEDGRIIEANRQFARMHGYSREEVIGEPVPRFIHPDDLPRAAAAMAGEAEHLGEYRDLRKDGSEIVVEAHGQTTTWNGRRVRFIALSDITARKRAEEAVQRSRQRAELLSHTISRLLHATDPQVVVQQVCDDVRQFLGCAVFFNYLVDSLTYRLRFNACGGVEPRIARLVEGLELSGSLCGTAARDNCRILAENLSVTFDERSKLVRSLGVRAYACHPLLGPGGEAFGTLSFGATDRDRFTNDDLAVMKALADHVAVAMLRKRAEEALRQSDERLRRIARAGQIGFFEWNATKDTSYWSPEHYELFGYEPDSPITWERWFAAVHPEDRDRVAHNAARLLERGRTEGEVRGHKDEYRFVRPDGSMVWLESEVSLDMVGGEAIVRGLVRDVTTRRQAEEAVAAAHRQVQSIIDNTPAVVYAFDLEERFLMANTAVASLLNSTPEQMIGKRRHEFMPKADADWHEANDRQVVEAGRPLEFEEYSHLKDRSITWLTTKFPLRDAQGKIYAVAGISTDVSERKQAEEALRESEERFRLALRATNDAIWDIDMQAGVIRWNEVYEKTFGRPPETSDSWQWWIDHIHPDDRARTAEGLREAVEGQAETWLCEYRFQRADGTWGEVFDRAYIARDSTGKARRVIGAMQDITERKRADEALRESEATVRRQLAELQAIYDNAPIGLSVMDTELRWVRINRRLAEMNGFPPEEHLGRSVRDLLPNLADQAEAMLRPIVQTGQPVRDLEFAGETPAQPGVKRTWKESFLPLRDAEGNVIGLNVVCEETTEQKRAEEAVRESERLYRAIGESIDYGVWVCDPEGRNTYASDSFLKLVGMTQQQCSDFGWGDVLHPEDADRTIAAWKECVRTGNTWDIEHRFRGVDGQWHSILARGVPVRNEQGQVTCWVGINLDISKLKQAQEELQDAKAAAEAANIAKSQFLANMSHELRTPMNAIMGMTELALGEALSPRLRDYLQTAKQSADGLLELVNEILDLSRIESGGFRLESTPFNLRTLVEQIIKTLGVRAQEKGLELLCDLPDVPAQVIGDPLRLRQALMNLVGNAVKFTSKGAVIVSAEAKSKEQHEVVLEFAVADTGIGIATEDRQRIFAPFTQADASTTRKYGGTGLGLTITQRLVDLMGGRIWVESESGKGSVFRFTARLGLQEGAEQEPGWPAVGREALHDLPVLVVAEHPTSGRILVETFRRWSMKPELADDVPTALTKVHDAASRGQKFRLVLADAVLPGTDGFTFAEWLRNDTKLAGPVILMITAADRCKQPRCCQDVGALCLEKPISQSALFNLVTEALGIQQQAAKTADSAPVLSETPSRLLRVLLAEDTPANQKLVTYVLSKRGHHVEVAPNGQQALETVGQQDFDVVLMDVQMPVMDGFHATAEIRRLADPKKARLPIIAMTAHALKGDAERCLAAGMDGYISKPVKGEELIELVERMAEQSVGPLAASTPGPVETTSPSTVAPFAATTSVFDLDDAVKHCYGKYNLFQDMVGSLFCEAGPLLEQIRTALANGNATEMGDAAHRLKGTVSYLGAAPATDATRRVEQIGRSGDLTEAAKAIDELANEVERLKETLGSHRQH